MRDTQLDMYRGLAMIYIVCFIHVISWFHIGGEPLVSMILFEMPVMFFIAGAAQSLSKKKKHFGHIVWSRIKRVVLPFYIYAIVSLIILLVLTILYKNLYPWILSTFGENVANKYSFNLFAYTWTDIRKIVLCQDIPQSPLMWHVWFVVPYFLLSCLFYGQQRLSDRLGGVFSPMYNALHCYLGTKN